MGTRPIYPFLAGLRKAREAVGRNILETIDPDAATRMVTEVRTEAETDQD